MKYFSLFSGIGGFEKGIEQAYDNNHRPDIRNRNKIVRKDLSDLAEQSDRPACVGYSEIDKYAIKTYQKHYPNHKNYGDITLINEKELPDFELLCGGFPCQSFSIAGKRGGFSDTRGTLFFDICRILRSKRPRFLLLENVKGLLSHDKGRTFRTIINSLDELGYDVQFQVLNSKNFGVPQNRERVFIVGHIRGTPRPEVFPFIGTDEKDTRNVGEDVAYTIDANYAKGTNTLEKSRRSVVKIVGGLQSHQTVREDEISPTLTTAMGQGGGQTPIVWSDDIKIRKLTPLECERLQGFPDNWTVGISDTQRYKCCGNAVTVNVIQAIIEKLMQCDLTIE